MAVRPWLRRLLARRPTAGSEYREGACVLSTVMADGYVPPSASMNPAATTKRETAMGGE